MEFDDKPVAGEGGSAEPVRPVNYAGSVRPGGEIDTLEQILDELRSIRREQQHREFSFWQLAGAMAQAVALCAIGLGGYAILNDDIHGATVRLLAGIAFQLLALTGFSAPRKS